MTDPHPEGLGVSTCIELALKDSGVERDEVRVAGVDSQLFLLPSCFCHSTHDSTCGKLVPSLFQLAAL